MKTRFSFNAALSGAVLCAATVTSAVPVRAADSIPVLVDQGANWTPTTRADFYTQDQGSRIMPLAWLEALKQSNGSPFLADSLGRYGYLPNPANSNGLPVGFVAASGPQGSQFAGMTCAACHTRQISADGKEYRIDGGPAIVDFQSFLTDLDAAVGRVLGDEPAFQTFARAVLGPPDPNPGDAALREDVQAWYLRYNTLMTRALPKVPWGPSRLDAVGMIFNRLTGLDLGPPPSYLISDNIKRADAPVRYPFLWNAAKQDYTQWPGFAENGTNLLGLARNLGEVYGVFAVFEPERAFLPFGINYLNNNSANFDGLCKLEDLMRKIGPPKWPLEWPVDTKLVKQGKAIYNGPKGGCSGCHGIQLGKIPDTWATPLKDVQTDTREWAILQWQAQTGVLKGRPIPPGLLTPRFGETASAFELLSGSVTGSIAQKVLSGWPICSPPGATARVAQGITPELVELPPAQQELRPPLQELPPALEDLKHAFHLPGQPSPSGTLIAQKTPVPVYEARVMEGIWAAAPYLHNGSVPTLYDLLLPVDQRPKAFKIGPAYDKTKVGLAIEQTKFDYTLKTTDCSGRNSGDSRCGHDYGTKLPPGEKKALLEYLKTL